MISKPLPACSFPPRHGITLFDPISVVAGMAVLAVILLPAVQQSREAARRTQCKNNLKQQGLAVANYEETYAFFPPALFTTGDTTALTSYRGATTADQLAATDAGFGTTWAVCLLPYMDSYSLYQAIDFDKRLEEQTEVTATPLEVFLCPSAGPATQMVGTAADDTLPPGVTYARGNYGYNLGGGNAHPIGPAEPADKNGPFGTLSPGVATPGLSKNRGIGTSPQSRTNLNSQLISVRDIIDGSSNTVLIGELLTDTGDSADSRGAWARGMGAVVSAFTRAKPADGLEGLARPNAPTIDRTDPAGPKLTLQADCPVFAATTKGPLVEPTSATACDGFGEDAAGGVAMRSRHPGGVNGCMSDGRVYFFAEAIDPLTYRALMTSAGDDIVGRF